MEEKVKFVCDLDDGRIVEIDERVVIALAKKALELDVGVGINKYVGHETSLYEYYDNHKNSLLYNNCQKIKSSTYGKKVLIACMEMIDFSEDSVFHCNEEEFHERFSYKAKLFQKLLDENNEFVASSQNKIIR